MSVLSDHLRINLRYRRSTNVVRDARDDDFFVRFKLTPAVGDVIERLGKLLPPKSSQRAWRLTGDYGTGKSTVALAFAAAAARAEPREPKEVHRLLDRHYVDRLTWAPILVSGSREPLSRTILSALRRTLTGEELLWVSFRPGRPQADLAKAVQKIDQALGESSESIPARRVLELIDTALPLITERTRKDGVLIVLDELGRFLEYAAMHSEEDIGLLQHLAERTANGTETALALIAVTHQSFDAYAVQLADVMRREWLKVAGRFEEVVLDPPPEQVAVLVSEAIALEKIPVNMFPYAEARTGMRAVIDMGWFGAVRDPSALIDLAPRIYPLHPTVLPIARALFARIGQNERSLLGFLASEEPCALSAWARQVAVDRKHPLSEFFTVADFFDYVRANLSHRLVNQRFRTSWTAAESIVDGLASNDDRAAAVVKAVALLDLIEHPALTATDAALKLCVPSPEADLGVILARLREAVPPVLHDRGSGGYCVWPKTSVNLERRFREAERNVERPQHVLSMVQSNLQARPLVARRHSIETGTLRYFDVIYSTGDSLKGDLAWKSSDGGPAGRVVIVLTESTAERDAALLMARTAVLQQRVLTVIPPPLDGLRNDVWEMNKWRWVETNTTGLEHDTYAAEEVSRQLRLIRDRIDTYISSSVTPTGSTGRGTDWFWCGKPERPSGRRGVLELLSNVCDAVFPAAPRVNNELVNRRQLSSAGAAARMRLIERMFSAPSLPAFGMDDSERSPEMSMYLSIFVRGRLHLATGGAGGGGAHVLALPEVDPLNLRPAMDAIRAILTESDDAVPVPVLIEALRAPPYGVRDGLAYLLVAIFYAIEGGTVSVYERDAFLPALNAPAYERLLKTPSSFTWQLHRKSAERDELLKRLEALAGGPHGPARGVVDVVRSLIATVKQLPLYSRRSRELTPVARSVLDTMAAARDPARLLFDELPVAVGLRGPQSGLFDGDGGQTSTGEVVPELFIARLEAALAEVQGHYDQLLKKVQFELFAAFRLDPTDVDAARASLAPRARALIANASSVEVRQFCAALSDPMPTREWLERLGLAVTGAPTDRWNDDDAKSFRQRVRRAVLVFQEAEAASAAFGRVPVSGVLVSLSSPDGQGGLRVVHADELDRDSVRRARDQIESVVRDAGGHGIAALVSALHRIVTDTASTARPGDLS